MILTGINYRSLPTANSLTAEFENISIAFSGDKHAAGEASGLHFGFSGTSDNLSFTLRSGKMYDPEGRVVFGYSENVPFSMSVSFDSSNYSYDINNIPYCLNGSKSDFDVNKFFFNCNGVTCDTTFKIYGPELSYSVTFPESYTTSSLNGTFTNDSSYDLKVFSGEIIGSYSGYYDVSALDNLSIAANTSESLTLIDQNNRTGVSYNFNLKLYTNFGDIIKSINVSRY